MWYIINDNYVSIVGYMAYLGDIIIELVDEMSKPKQAMPGSTVRRSITIHLPSGVIKCGESWKILWFIQYMNFPAN